jgi:hypothetical protein
VSMCGPENPCAQCRPMYEDDERYAPEKNGPGFVPAAGRRRGVRRPRGGAGATLHAKDRLPVVSGSRRAEKARRRQRRQRRS